MSTPTATIHDRYSDDAVKGFYESGYWRSETLFDEISRQAARRPQKRFIFDSTTSLTYAGLYEQTVRLAAGLRRLGIGRGDRIIVQLPNWTEFVVISSALARVGAIIVPIMPIYRDAEVGYVANHSGAVMAFTAEQFNEYRYLEMFDRLRPEAPALRHLVAVRPAGVSGVAGTIRLDDLFAGGDLGALAADLGDDTSPDDGLLIVYTSGTTARPKGCYHTLNTVRASGLAISEALRYSDEDVQFGPSPIAHSTGLMTSFVVPLINGASSHLMERWEAGEGMRRIREHGCTVAVTATAFLQMMMSAYEPGVHDVSCMRLWVCAGAPIPGSVVERSGAMLRGGRVLSLYGRSENYLTTMCTVDDPPERSVTSDGSALNGASVQIVDALGAQVPRGVPGDIAYRGPSHMLEYYRDPDQTAALFTPEGYSRSGDLGYMDEDGFVRVTGRLKDIIIRGGLNISARELEDLLEEHPAVRSAAVVGYPDERLGEKVCAYVVVAQDAEPPTLPALTAYLRERKVATPKLPERVEFVDALPMTATGKIQKHVLRDDVATKVAAAP